jgi:hypothetical protein
MQKYNTQYSRVVTHHSTDWALRSLAYKIGRVCAFSTRYGRICRYTNVVVYKQNFDVTKGQQSTWQTDCGFLHQV